MNNDNPLIPADFDGIFRFTNATNEDFTAKWGGVAYTFPAMKTSPMIMSNCTPNEVQNIRKKFAKELAEREFYKGNKMKALEGSTPIGSVGSFQNASTYADADLLPFINQCLEPLPVAQATAKVVPARKIVMRKDEKGKDVTKVLDEGEDIVQGDVIA